MTSTTSPVVVHHALPSVEFSLRAGRDVIVATPVGEDRRESSSDRGGVTPPPSLPSYSLPSLPLALAPYLPVVTRVPAVSIARLHPPGLHARSAQLVQNEGQSRAKGAECCPKRQDGDGRSEMAGCHGRFARRLVCCTSAVARMLPGVVGGTAGRQSIGRAGGGISTIMVDFHSSTVAVRAQPETELPVTTVREATQTVICHPHPHHSVRGLPPFLLRRGRWERCAVQTRPISSHRSLLLLAASHPCHSSPSTCLSHRPASYCTR